MGQKQKQVGFILIDKFYKDLVNNLRKLELNIVGCSYKSIPFQL